MLCGREAVFFGTFTCSLAARGNVADWPCIKDIFNAGGLR